MITPQRKKNISELTRSLAEHFYTGTPVSLEDIARDEDVFFYYDHYENHFDGMLVYDAGNFHIHLNEDRGNTRNSSRGRFSFAHELGHYFIDEHFQGLKNGTLKVHGSFHSLFQKDILEREADYFAACLLMPEDEFKKQALRKKFSFEAILDLSKQFKTSVVATTIRFAEIGTHPILVVFSENNIVRWFTQSEDFPKWSYKFKTGGNVPPSTVAGEFFTRNKSKYTGIEQVQPDDWFYPSWKATTKMYEQCYYSDTYGYVISLIWFV